MGRNGIKLKIIRGLLFLIFFFLPSVVVAETKVFTEEYTYQASEADSKLSSRVIALEQVKRLLLEKLGTYLESETEVKNFQLTKDQIVILTAGIVRTEVIDEKWDGKTYSLKAKITADLKDVASSIDKLRQDRQKTKELEETRKKADEALREVERLKKELEISKAGKAEQDQYNEAVNRLSALEYAQRGNAELKRGDLADYRQALRDFNKAIELDPKEALAYFLRGISYYGLGDYRQAIRDYDKFIELDPELADVLLVYFGRGHAHYDLGEYRRAIRDFDKTIELNPRYIGAYHLRGFSYVKLGDYRPAIRDFNTAIDLDPKDANTYFNRALAYTGLGNWQKAIKDYDRAIELDPKEDKPYARRGDVYNNMGDYRRAIEDYDRAIELNPKLAEAYWHRGMAHYKLGNHRQALKDVKIAARLGDTGAQDSLREMGINW